MKDKVIERIKELRSELGSCQDTKKTLENALGATQQRILEITAILREYEDLIRSLKVDQVPPSSHQS